MILAQTAVIAFVEYAGRAKDTEYVYNNVQNKNKQKKRKFESLL